MKLLENLFWGIWFIGIALFVSLRGSESGSFTMPLIAAGIGAGLVTLVWLLRERALFKNIVNFGAAGLWLVLYFMIGYPNLLRPSGERPIGALLLLILIAVLPISFFLTARFCRSRST